MARQWLEQVNCLKPLCAQGWQGRQEDRRKHFLEAVNCDPFLERYVQLLKDFPPRATAYNYFWEWTRYAVLDRIHQALLV